MLKPLQRHLRALHNIPRLLARASTARTEHAPPAQRRVQHPRTHTPRRPHAESPIRSRTHRRRHRGRDAPCNDAAQCLQYGSMPASVISLRRRGSPFASARTQPAAGARAPGPADPLSALARALSTPGVVHIALCTSGGPFARFARAAAACGAASGDEGARRAVPRSGRRSDGGRFSRTRVIPSSFSVRLRARFKACSWRAGSELVR